MDSEIPPPAGTRFTVNLEDEIDQDNLSSLPSSNGFINDITERSVSSIALPPTLGDSKDSGFPAHTKRKRQSAFNQRRRDFGNPNTSARNVISKSIGTPAGIQNKDVEDLKQIKEENDRRVNSMSSKQLEKERQELLDSLSPELLQMFLKRASLDVPIESGRNDNPSDDHTTSSKPSLQPRVEEDEEESSKLLEKTPKANNKKVTFSNIDDDAEPVISDINEPKRPKHLQEIPESNFPPEISNVHFPSHPKITDEDPDPASPAFLEHLHKKYFPDLPADPSKLEWMKPPDPSKVDSYSPNLSSIVPSAIRFDFKGNLLPPRTSRELPTHLGLHHHGDAPLSAGYTIPELSHLARSSFPAQRCMAFQTLGRILYKLGIGEYKLNDQEGQRYENEDLSRGLWRCVKEGRAIESLQEAASGGPNKTGHHHLGVKNYATEALWLWQQGGGQQWKAD